MRFSKRLHLTPFFKCTLLLSMSTWVFAGFVFAQKPMIEKDANGCIKSFDATQDYFAAKSSIVHGKSWEIEYRNYYKIVRIINPWYQNDLTYEFVLLQCGAPAPKGFDKSQIVNIPVKKIVPLSTTYLGFLAELKVVDSVVGLADFKQVNTPSFLEAISRNEIEEVGSYQDLNLEKLLVMQPDVIVTFGINQSFSAIYDPLINQGIKIVVNADYRETSVLGRSEWIKFFGLFYNLEKKANAIFENWETQYRAMGDNEANNKRSSKQRRNFLNTKSTKIRESFSECIL